MVGPKYTARPVKRAAAVADFEDLASLGRELGMRALALLSGLLLLQAAVRGSAVLTRTTKAGGSPAKVRRRGPPPLTASVTFAPSFKAAYRARGSAPLTATKGPLLHEYVVSARTPRHELSAMLHGLSGSGQVEAASQLLRHALEVDPHAHIAGPQPFVLALTVASHSSAP